MRKSKEMSREEIRWVDSRSENGWTGQDELDLKLAKITTVGHVVKETADVLAVACSVDKATKQVTGVIFISQACVVSRKKLVYENQDVSS